MKKKNDTFWLARNKGIQDSYIINNTFMGSIGSADGKEEYFHGDISMSKKYHDILGLPTLRKGQQVQLRRTPQGWEVVK